MTPEEREDLLATLRRHGVRKFSMTVDGLPFHVELTWPHGPDPLPMGQAGVPIATSDPFPALEDIGPPLCACGHSLTDHNGPGLCIHACAPNRCEPPKEPNP